MSELASGDAGFCSFLHHAIGVVITWDGEKVTAVDCQHEVCGMADRCELYQRHPVGFIRRPTKCPEHQ